MDHRRQMCVPRVHERIALPQLPQSPVSRRVRPPVRVQIRHQSHELRSVRRCRCPENRLTERHLEIRASPVARPVPHKLQLPLPENRRPWRIVSLPVEIRIRHMIRTSARRRHDPFGSALELPVLDDPETHPPIEQVRVIHPNPLFHRTPVERIRQMRRLRPLHHVHPLRRHHIPAPLVLFQGLFPASAPPDIALVHIMIVRHVHRRPVPHQISETPPHQIPLPQVIYRRGLHRQPLNSITRHILVNLIPREEKQIRTVVKQVLHCWQIWKSRVLISCEARHHDRPLVHRVPPHRPLPVMRRRLSAFALQLINQPVPHILRRIPIRHAECRRSSQRVDHFFVNPLPLSALLHLQRHRRRIFHAQRRHLRRHLQHPFRQGVLRPQNRSECPLRVRLHARSSYFPVVKPIQRRSPPWTRRRPCSTSAPLPMRHQRHVPSQPAPRRHQHRLARLPPASRFHCRQRQPHRIPLRYARQHQLHLPQTNPRIAPLLDQLKLLRSDEQLPRCRDPRVQTPPVYRRRPVILHRSHNPDPKTRPTRRQLPLRMQPPQLDRHAESRVLTSQRVRQQLNIPVHPAHNALQPPLRHPPVLQRIRPVLRTNPSPLRVLHKIARELRRGKHTPHHHQTQRRRACQEPFCCHSAIIFSHPLPPYNQFPAGDRLKTVWSYGFLIRAQPPSVTRTSGVRRSDNFRESALGRAGPMSPRSLAIDFLGNPEPDPADPVSCDLSGPLPVSPSFSGPSKWR